MFKRLFFQTNMDQTNIFPQHIVVESLLTTLRGFLKMHSQSNARKQVEIFISKRFVLLS